MRVNIPWRPLVLMITVLLSGANFLRAQSGHDLQSDSLARRWDEAMPLGNGLIGALVWENNDSLRFSLDQARLWDQRPMAGLHRPEFSYQWIMEKVFSKDYAPVQRYFDYPYDHEAAPTKIPGAAMQFNSAQLGRVTSARLEIEKALCTVEWTSGARLQTFVHATEPVGWFRFDKVPAGFEPVLIPPKYQGAVRIAGDPVGGDDLSRLGYPQGRIERKGNRIVYRQEDYNGFYYLVAIEWKWEGGTMTGAWSISAHEPAAKVPDAPSILHMAQARGYESEYNSHVQWWKKFWSASALSIPDPVLEKQWYLEQYKFGSASRRGAPPISLQAIWTADNGRIAPWKGDYHHDLNTQLSYWPAYSANHLEEALAYLDHLDENRSNYKRYTKLFFNKPGLAVPGVTTLDGTEMGGWIQYSLSPTVSSWLAHHYYLQWKYSMDKQFLKQRAYPWVREVCVFLESITEIDSAGYRGLKISSSPEFFDNSLRAWFLQTTNYDLALMTFSFKAAADMAAALGLRAEADRWKKIAGQFRPLAINDGDELMIAPGFHYDQSHRHFSHLMAIHPLGLIDWSDGSGSQHIIQRSLQALDSVGPANWCGYSYSWEANLKARARDGEGAARALRIFATAFCSPNSFHLNGDQSGKNYSTFTYRPFTLEGNFAFAAGLQEMLIQSHPGYIQLFPAIPADWKNVSFKTLRTEGAFLVSAELKDGIIASIEIQSLKGTTSRMQFNLDPARYAVEGKLKLRPMENGFAEISGPAGARVQIRMK